MKRVECEGGPFGPERVGVGAPEEGVDGDGDEQADDGTGDARGDDEAQEGEEACGWDALQKLVEDEAAEQDGQLGAEDYARNSKKVEAKAQLFGR